MLFRSDFCSRPRPPQGRTEAGLLPRPHPRPLRANRGRSPPHPRPLRANRGRIMGKDSVSGGALTRLRSLSTNTTSLGPTFSRSRSLDLHRGHHRGHRCDSELLDFKGERPSIDHIQKGKQQVPLGTITITKQIR